jgi:UDP-N-acetylglucosamine 2-epimerase (non-hydrolysing)
MEEFGIMQPAGIKFIEPLGFLEFLVLESKAKLIITDSGGIQEEASILHIPCVTVRDNTERPETIDAGINILAGTEPQKILAAVQELLAKEHQWPAIFGDGHAGERIIENLVKNA